MTSETLELLLKKLPPKARRAFRCPKIRHNLIAVAELCNAGCIVLFRMDAVLVEYNGEIILRGWRDKRSNLWRVPIVPDEQELHFKRGMLGSSEGAPDPRVRAGTSEGERPNIIPETPYEEYDPKDSIIFNAEVNAIYKCENKEQLIEYYHASLCSHPKLTLIAAAKRRFLRGFKGLNEQSIRKYIGIEDATGIGHMKQREKGVRSTTLRSSRGRKPQLPSAKQQPEAAQLPEQAPGNEKTHEVAMSVMSTEGFFASDQTGPMPITSNRRHKYVCVFYVYDPNYIKGIPIKSRKKEELMRAYQKVYKWCTLRGCKPKLHKLDNETSKEVEEFIAEQNAKQQYTPPDMHQTNPVERAIQTYKSVYI